MYIFAQRRELELGTWSISSTVFPASASRLLLLKSLRSTARGTATYPAGSTDVLSSRYRLGSSGKRFATTSSISTCRAGKSLHLGNTATGHCPTSSSMIREKCAPTPEVSPHGCTANARQRLSLVEETTQGSKQNMTTRDHIQPTASPSHCHVMSKKILNMLYHVPANCSPCCPSCCTAPSCKKCKASQIATHHKVSCSS